MSKHFCVLLLSALAALLPARLPAADPAPAPAQAADSGDSASLLERKLLTVARDGEKLFSDMEAGSLTQEDFERKVLQISYRYDELILRDPHNVNTLILYGKFLRRVGQNDVANTMFIHADQLSPDLAVVKQQLGNYLAEQGNYAGALVLYLKAVDLAPREAVYHYGLGELLATYRDKFVADGAFTGTAIDDQILAAFAKAQELDPTCKDFAFRHGEAYYDLGTPRWEEALEEWTKVAARSDLSSYEKDAARLHLARVNCELGRKAEALALLRDDVTPVLQATRARLLRRVSAANSAAEDRKNAEAILPGGQRPSDTSAAPPQDKSLPGGGVSSTTSADSSSR
jgi:tetratricopeptide (TPR) repeat protein